MSIPEEETKEERTPAPFEEVEVPFGEPTTPYKYSGLDRIRYSIKYSIEGIGAAFKHESAFRQEAFLFIFLAPLAILLPFNWPAKGLIIASMVLVLIVELLNSALEWIVDYISFDKHPMAKRAKDMGSGAVMLSLINAGFVWAFVLYEFWPEVIDFF